jgi:sugar diacid utilization regulator
MSVPTGSPALLEVAGRLAQRRDEIVGRMVERYRDEIPDYRLADDDYLFADVYRVSGDNLDVLLAELGIGRVPAGQDVATTREGAARRVRQGISLEAFLRAARLWSHTLWDAVLEVTDPAEPEEREAALEIVRHILRQTDTFSTVAGQAYIDEVQAQWSDREVVTREMLDGLVCGQGDSERIQRLARSIRLRLAGTYVAVLARGGDELAQETPDQPLAARAALRRIVEAARLHLRPRGGASVVGMRHGEVVALYPVDGTADLARIEAQAAAYAVALAADDVAVGIGGLHAGLPGVARSYCEARDAVEIAVGTGIRGRPIVFDDVLIDQMVRSSPHADRILETTLHPLLDYDRDHQSGLVATLKAYVESGFNLTRTAEILSVHANTVVYRLRRIRELTGRDPREPSDLLLLFFGLKLLDFGAAR